MDPTSVPPLSRHDALALLHQRHYPELVRMAFALTGDPSLAEELAQEAFVRAWRNWTNLRRQQAAPAYLRTTVVNLARTSLRRRLKEAREVQNAGAARDADVPEPTGPATRVDVLRALGISVGTVKSQTARALQQLRPLLSHDEATANHPDRGRSGSGD